MSKTGNSLKEGAKNKKRSKGRVAAIITVAVAAVLISALLIINIFFPLRYFTAYLVIGHKPAQGELSVRVLDVGQADCAIVCFPDGKTMLIDGGDGTYVSTVKILTELNRLDIDRIDYLVCTSVKDQHCGGLAEIIRMKQVGTIFGPYCNDRYITDSYSEFYAAAETCGAELEIAEYGSGAECGGAFFMFLSPAVHTAPGGAYEELNSDPDAEAIDEASAVLWLEYEDTGIFYAGDAPSSVLDRIAEEYKIASGAGGAFSFRGHTIDFGDCKVYKVAGHGGEEYRSAELTDMLSPEISVISAGENNAEGCPSAGVLADLSAHGNIYMTMYRGDVTVRIGGGKCTAECASRR